MEHPAHATMNNCQAQGYCTEKPTLVAPGSRVQVGLHPSGSSERHGYSPSELGISYHDKTHHVGIPALLRVRDAATAATAIGRALIRDCHFDCHLWPRLVSLSSHLPFWDGSMGLDFDFDPKRPVRTYRCGGCTLARKVPPKMECLATSLSEGRPGSNRFGTPPPSVNRDRLFRHAFSPRLAQIFLSQFPFFP